MMSCWQCFPSEDCEYKRAMIYAGSDHFICHQQQQLFPANFNEMKGYTVPGGRSKSALVTF